MLNLYSSIIVFIVSPLTIKIIIYYYRINNSLQRQHLKQGWGIIFIFLLQATNAQGKKKIDHRPHISGKKTDFYIFLGEKKTVRLLLQHDFSFKMLSLKVPMS